jgi:threonine aldolase
MIDIRSDTVTLPSPEMKEAMMAAPLGDDVYGEDPSVNELQELTAEIFGKEGALFVPSGTMGNQICLKIQTQPGDEIIADADAHIFFYETAGPSILSSIQVNTIKSTSGMPDLDEVESAIRPDIYYFPKTRMFCLENTHNRHGGTVLDGEYTKKAKEICDNHGLAFHLDGARIWHATAATGESLKSLAEPFDTVSVCFSKGMGAPVGSAIVSTKENIAKALHWRKIFGGGMRQAGMLAAAATYSIKYNLPKLGLDIENAKAFANSINESELIDCDLSKVQTNIVAFKIAGQADTDKFVSICKRNGVILSAIGKNHIRVVFHLQITGKMALEAAEIIKSSVKESIEN